jgi:hypothetical protein
MFKGKCSIAKPQKEEGIVNMVLIVTTRSKTMIQEELKEK